MKEIDKLLDIIEQLLAPEGCPWDKEQTLMSMRPLLLEEAAELIDAINLNDSLKIEEELGDLLFVVLFLGFLAAKEQKSSLKKATDRVNEKLIRRHPHIFGEAKVSNTEDVLQQWEEIKKQEKQGAVHCPIGRIPNSLPALARAQEILKAMKKRSIDLQENPPASLEEEIGQELLKLVKKSLEAGVDAEQALRRVLLQSEAAFHEKEKKPR